MIPTTRRRWSAAAFLVLAAAACVGSAPKDSSADPATATPATATVPRALPFEPVDTALQAVSMSNPGADAKAALDLCVRPEDYDKIAGMARLPARDVHRFTYTNGHEPELQRADDRLVWAIQLRGEFPSRVGSQVIDPLCVVIDGTSYMYVPYGHVGETFVPPADFVPPVAALPSMAP